MAFKLLTITEALANDYINGRITLEDAAAELHRAGLFSYIPGRSQTLHKMGINSMCHECTRPDCRGTTCQTWTGCIYRTASR